MMIETKCEIKDGSNIIPKGTNGIVKACQWGEKKDGYIISFPQSSELYVSKEDVVILTADKPLEKETVKTHTSYEKDKKEIKVDKQTRKKEL